MYGRVVWTVYDVASGFWVRILAAPTFLLFMFNRQDPLVTEVKNATPTWTFFLNQSFEVYFVKIRPHALSP